MLAIAGHERPRNPAQARCEQSPQSQPHPLAHQCSASLHALEPCAAHWQRSSEVQAGNRLHSFRQFDAVPCTAGPAAKNKLKPVAFSFVGRLCCLSAAARPTSPGRLHPTREAQNFRQNGSKWSEVCPRGFKIREACLEDSFDASAL